MKQAVQKTKDGFTLIELIVVIAIIGILASIAYVGLGTARNNSRDKSAGIAMQNILIEAAFYRGTNGSYADFCADTTTKMDELVVQITRDASNAPTCDNDGATGDSFGVIVELNDGDYYCVDSAKTFGVRTTGALNGGLCPAT